MSRLIRTSAIALAAGSLVLFACGSSGDDGAESTTTTAEVTTTTADPAAEFSAAIDDLCAEGDAATTQASDDFQVALDDLQAASEAGDDAAYATALDAAETATEDIISALEDFDTAVGELEVPTELQQPLTTYLDALGTQLALADQLRAAIVADDGPAFNEAVGQIQQADEATTQARADAAEEMGAPECAPDDESDGSSGTDTTEATDTTDTTAAG